MSAANQASSDRCVPQAALVVVLRRSQREGGTQTACVARQRPGILRRAQSAVESEAKRIAFAAKRDRVSLAHMCNGGRSRAPSSVDPGSAAILAAGGARAEFAAHLTGPTA